MCIDAHEKQLLDHGISKTQIQTAVRIAATVQAVSAILDGEDAMTNSTTVAQAA